MHRAMALTWLSVAGAMGQTADSLWNGLRTAKWLEDSSARQSDRACRAIMHLTTWRMRGQTEDGATGRRSALAGLRSSLAPALLRYIRKRQRRCAQQLRQHGVELSLRNFGDRLHGSSIPCP